MSVFGSILSKIFHHGNNTSAAATPQAGQQAQPTAPTMPQAQQSTGQTQQSMATGTSAAQPSLQSVDVEAVLTRLASTKGGGGNWKTSIVDLLKLLDLDSSLTARKELAQELNVHAGADGTAEQNIALSKAVMQKLADNGGKVPESLRH